MIEIDRIRVPIPEVLNLDDANSLAAKETAKAIAYYEDPDHNPKPKFDVYSHDDVKTALIKLFNLKCAYCEIRVTSARDIEHFRPKGRIDPGPGQDAITPGYYWLAAKWDNLLLSCPDCNQRKRALVRDENGEWTFAENSTGKLDLFPLNDEARRVTSHEHDIDDEESARLLLNPCKDQITRHLRFDTEGNIIERRINGRTSEMATASIGVYVLRRATLVEARKAKYLDMVQNCREPMDTAAAVVDSFESGALPDDFKRIILASLSKTRDVLNGFTADREEFAGMARWLVKPLLKNLVEIERRFKAKFGE